MDSFTQFNFWKARICVERGIVGVKCLAQEQESNPDHSIQGRAHKPWATMKEVLLLLLFFLGLSRCSPPGVAVVNFKPDMFSFLNITSLGSDLAADNMDCGFTCLEIPSCFSYNVAAYPDINGKFLCEPLPSDKFNNSDKFTDSPLYHHFSIPVSTNWFLLQLWYSRRSKVFSKFSQKCHCLLHAAVCVRSFIAQIQARKIHGVSCSDSDHEEVSH